MIHKIRKWDLQIDITKLNTRYIVKFQRSHSDPIVFPYTSNNLKEVIDYFINMYLNDKRLRVENSSVVDWIEKNFVKEEINFILEKSGVKL